MLTEETSFLSAQDTELPEEKFVEEEEEDPSLLVISSKDRKLVTHPYDFIIRSLKGQIDDKTLILADKFQRRRVWDEIKSSRLIESLLLNVPIPVCYFAELDDGSYSVIDGQQRLTAIYRFVNNEFALKSLKVRPDLNGKRFHQLDVSDSRLVNSRAIRCIVILKESDPDIRFDVFERLNTNSVKLNPQELRNSLYRGKLNDLIQKLSEYENFKKARAADNVDKRMQDCEIILRFFAFHFRGRDYRGALAPFLDNYLKEGKRFNEATLHDHQVLFKRVIDDVQYVFADHSFRRYTREQGWEKSINRAIYDVVMLYFAQLSSQLIREKSDEIVEAMKDLCEDTEFNEAISSSTKNRGRLQTRLDKWQSALLRVGVDVVRLQIGQ